jgi:DNA polymerase III sliding clamp (beta) subunit (PCNA family)
VHIDLSGSMRPGILRSAEESDFLYLIMPVRV